MYTGTEYVVNISDTHVASYGFKVDHTYLSHDAVETLIALTIYWAPGSMKLHILITGMPKCPRGVT